MRLLRLCTIVFLAGISGCSVLTTQEEVLNMKGQKLKAGGNYLAALPKFKEILERHPGDIDHDPVLLSIKVDLCECYYELGRLAEAKADLESLLDGSKDSLLPEDLDKALELAGWTHLKMGREGEADSQDKLSAFLEARKYFSELLNRDSGHYEGRLGRGVSLLEVGKFHETKTHLVHTIDVLEQCRQEKIDDPLLLYALAQAIQGVKGEATGEALDLFFEALTHDDNFEEKVVYGEIYEYIKPFRNPDILESEAEEKKRLIEKYIDFLSKAEEKSRRLAKSRKPFWNDIKNHLEHYKKWPQIKKAFHAGVAEAINLEHDAQGAMNTLLDTITNFKGKILLDDERDLLLGVPRIKKIKNDIQVSRFSALYDEIIDSIKIRDLDAAEGLFEDIAFTLKWMTDFRTAAEWDRKFDDLQEELENWKVLVEKIQKLNNNISNMVPAEVIEKLANLKREYPGEDQQREIEDREDEFTKKLMDHFEAILVKARKAALENKREEAQKRLKQALNDYVDKIPELKEREGEVQIRLAETCMESGDPNQRNEAQAVLEQVIIHAVDEKRAKEAELLLGIILAMKGEFDEAYAYFGKQQVSLEDLKKLKDLKKEYHLSAAAGLTFSDNGRKDIQAVELLDYALNKRLDDALNNLTPDARPLFSQEKLHASLCASIIRILNNTRDETEDPSAGIIKIAEKNVDAEHPELGKSLGMYYFRKKQWVKAHEYLDGTGGTSDTMLLLKLKASVTDYFPLSAGRSLKYLRNDGKQMIVTIENQINEADRKYSISIQIDGKMEFGEWSKPRDSGHKVMFQKMGEAITHELPIGIDPSRGWALPERNYHLNNITWHAKLVSLNKTVKRDKTGDREGEVWENCLLVEVTRKVDSSIPDTKTKPVRHYFAPGIGEVKVEYPDNRKSYTLLEVRQ